MSSLTEEGGVSSLTEEGGVSSLTELGLWVRPTADHLDRGKPAVVPQPFAGGRVLPCVRPHSAGGGIVCNNYAED